MEFKSTLNINNYFGDGELRSVELMRCKVDIFETFERNRVRYILDIQGSKE